MKSHQDKQVPLQLARKIKLLLLDVDGVLTDGKLYLDDEGRQMRVFSIRDGQGLVLLRKAGVRIGIITGCTSKTLEIRAKQLAIEELHQGVDDKLKVYEDILLRYQLSDDEVAYMGDDVPDKPILQRVGLSVTVPNAHESLNEVVNCVTQEEGGSGAVREVCDLILKASSENSTC